MKKEPQPNWFSTGVHNKLELSRFLLFCSPRCTQVTDFPSELFAKALHSCSLPVCLDFVRWTGILTSSGIVIETKIGRKSMKIDSQKHWLDARPFWQTSPQNAQDIYRNHCCWVVVVPELLSCQSVWVKNTTTNHEGSAIRKHQIFTVLRFGLQLKKSAQYADGAVLCPSQGIHYQNQGPR